MFDVSWTDPTRETIGQRKSRKDQHINSVSRDPSVQSSKSNDSTQLPNRPSILNVLQGSSKHDYHSITARNKTTLARADSNPKPSSLQSDDSITVSRRMSTKTAASDRVANRLPVLRGTNNAAFGNYSGESSSHSDGARSFNSEASESILSGWTGGSKATDSTWSSVVDTDANKGRLFQSFGGNSYITQSTEVTVSPVDNMKDGERIARLVSISTAGSPSIEINNNVKKLSIDSSKYETPLSDSENQEYYNFSPSSILRQPQNHAWQVQMQGKLMDSLHRETSEPPGKEKGDVNSSTLRLLGPPSARVIEKRQITTPIDLSALQRNIRRMEAAGPKIVLERLKEEWNEVADASVYRELELEKQLWMLTALQDLKTKSNRDSTFFDNSPSLRYSPTQAKVLSLYENHASSSFLSALNPLAKIHHISTAPLSPASYPNIKPLCVQCPTAQLPYTSNIFKSINAFSLPTVLPASSIPLILKECHRTLISPSHSPHTDHDFLLPPAAPSSPVSFSSSSTATVRPRKPTTEQKAGALNLTILDPRPLPDALGPKFRAWLDDHLIINLERQFRCINPVRLFTLWLTDARLDGEGSTVANLLFFAHVSVGDFTSSYAGRKRILDTTEELESVLGRMLWKEMWGGFVEGERWWWEVEEIMEECMRLGTRWEYALITAVKEG